MRRLEAHGCFGWQGILLALVQVNDQAQEACCACFKLQLHTC